MQVLGPISEDGDDISESIFNLQLGPWVKLNPIT